MPSVQSVLGKSWKSCIGTKAKWNHDEVKALAKDLHDALPARARALLRSKAWEGGPIIKIDDEATWNVTEPDVEANACWLRPLIERYADRIPSVYFMADVYMELHLMMECRLLQGKNPEDTPRTLAMQEAGKHKKVLQKLRQMWRDWPVGARSEAVADLKALLYKKAPSTMLSPAIESDGSSQPSPVITTQPSPASVASSQPSLASSPASVASSPASSPALLAAFAPTQASKSSWRLEHGAVQMCNV